MDGEDIRFFAFVVDWTAKISDLRVMQADQTVLSLRPGGGTRGRVLVSRFDSSTAPSSDLPLLRSRGGTAASSLSYSKTGESHFEGRKRIRYTRDQLLQLREVVNIPADILRVKQEVETEFFGTDPSWGRGENNSNYSKLDNRDWRNRSAQFPVPADERSREAIRDREFGQIDPRLQDVNQYNKQEQLSTQFGTLQISSNQGICPEEENVEAICQFFKTIGKQLDENPESKHINDMYFNCLKELSTNPQLAARMRFLVRNVLDLRANNWVPRQEEVAPTLVKTEVPWSARRGNLSEKDRVLKTVKGILNKLTPEKFGVLKGQLIDSGITTADISKLNDVANLIQGVISFIFDKAVLEPTFCPMYALLCSDLNEKLPPFPSDEPGGREITFMRVLLNNCQEAFEGDDKLRE